MTFSVGGLSTGLDTKSIINQLLSLDGKPKQRAEWNKALWDARKSGWNDLSTRLSSLQTFSNSLTTPSLWASSSGITSSVPGEVSATAGTKPSPGTYEIEVSQLATNETWGATSSLPAASGGVRQTGVWYKSGLAQLTSTDLLSATVDQTGTSAGVATNGTITMSWNSGSSTRSATFEVIAGATFGDLASWAQAQIPGSTVAINGGRLEVTSPPGTANEVTSLSFSGRNSAGTALARFNGSFGASSSVVTPASDGGAPEDETLTITQGSTTRYVNISAGDTQAEIVSKIQSTAGSIVTAGISGGNITLTSATSGATGGFTVSGSGSLLTTIGLAETVAGQDASFTVGGTAYTRSSNTGISDVITGVNLNLSSVTTAPVTLTVGSSGATTEDIKKKILDFTNQYNSIIDLVSMKTSEKRITSPKNLSEFLQAPMAGETRYGRVADDLRTRMTAVVTGQPSGFMTLADIGITTGVIGSGDRSGKLIVDETKLEEAINTNRTAVRDLFTKMGTGTGVTADDGVARKISETISQLRVGGSVDSAIQGANAQIQSLQTSITRFTTQLDAKRVYYERMFTGLEKSVGAMQSQGSWLSGQLTAMYNR